MNTLDKFKYVDCISGVDHLHRIEVDKESDKELIKKFVYCYFKGSETSQCGRSVINRDVLIKNLTHTLNDSVTDVIYSTVAKIIGAAFKGLWDNCAINQGDHYLPKND